MAPSDKLLTRARRTRRNVTKAAVIALGALLGLAARPKPASAFFHHGPDHKPCFLRGARIRTAVGNRPVEELAVGDFVPTHFGGMRAIRRIASHDFTRSGRGMPWPREARPVRIARSALGEGIPHAVLYLTGSHALLIDGVLVRAGDLLNGTTITLDDAESFDRLEYFHIELEEHDVLEAEGAACESLLTGAPCVPVLSFNGRRNEVKSRLRSALSLVADRRQPLDVIRDRLEERALSTV